MESEQTFNQFINTLIDEKAESVGLLLAEDPANSGMDKAVVKSTLKEILGEEEERKHISSGIHILFDQMERFFSKVEVKEIKEIWAKGITSLQEAAKHSTSVTSLKELLGISEDIFEKFYSIGTTLFEKQEFEKASDLFFVLVNLDHARSNLWIAFGLSLYRSAKLQPALKAFAMAAINDIDSPIPYINAARCCIDLKDREEAKNYINLAESKAQGMDAFKEQIKNLKNSCQ